MKTCTQCERVLPVDMFHEAAAYKGGRRCQCRDCINATRRKNFALNKTKPIKKVGTWESLDESLSKWKSDIG